MYLTHMDINTGDTVTLCSWLGNKTATVIRIEWLPGDEYQPSTRCAYLRHEDGHYFHASITSLSLDN